jgi:hypothetical protein
VAGIRAGELGTMNDEGEIHSVEGKQNDVVYFKSDEVPFAIYPWGDQEPGAKIECGHPFSLIIDKMYGPLVFTDIRISTDYANCEWVIERQWIATGEWQEWCRIPGQIEEEFA